MMEEITPVNEEKLKKKKKKKKADKYGRGIETMYKVVYRNQINLSAIADNKANMLIGINAILLSLIITMVGGGTIMIDNFTTDWKFLVPLTILILSTVAAMINATIVARPNIAKMTQYNENMTLFFFENFAQLGQKGFQEKMIELRTDDSQLYDNMTLDIYGHGMVLSKKYRRLKVAYGIFMYGLIIAVSLFFIFQIFFD